MDSAVETPEPARRDFLHHRATQAALPFVTGFISGSIATTCVQPLDTVKVRIQLTGEGTKGGPKANPFAVAKTIISQTGFTGLYAGLSAGYLRQAVYGTCRLGFFGTFERLLKERAEENGTKYGFGHRALAGLSAGVLAAAIGNPAEVALIRMQSDGMKPKDQRANYRSAIDALTRIARNEGIFALWSGAYPTVVRAMSTNFGQLAFFSESKHQLKEHTNLSAQSQTIAASAIAGFFASFFSLPFDFVKTRLQRQTKVSDGSVQHYRGMFDCFVKVTKDEGLLRFYRGFGTYFMRIAPHSIISLIAFDNFARLLK